MGPVFLCVILIAGGGFLFLGTGHKSSELGRIIFFVALWFLLYELVHGKSFG